MFDLKPISADAIPRAVAKAERYRLLGEPEEAESICRDILHVQRDNQEALVTLLLSMTDQFGKQPDVLPRQAQNVARRLQGEYERAYYSGIVCERWVKSHVDGGGSGDGMYGWLQEAMEWYRDAQAVSPPGNDDAVLRWNACVRFLARHEELLRSGSDLGEAEIFSEFTPTV